MIASNIFKLIGELFTWILTPFNETRLGRLNWWLENAVNWFFLAVLLVLLAYWMSEIRRFKREGIEDSAE